MSAAYIFLGSLTACTVSKSLIFFFPDSYTSLRASAICKREVRTAGGHSGTARRTVQGQPDVLSHSLAPLSRTRPVRACAGTTSVCGDPSDPYAPPSAPQAPRLGRAQPGARRRSGASAPPYGGPFTVAVPAPANCLGLSATVAARRYAAVPAAPPRGGLWRPRLRRDRFLRLPAPAPLIRV